MAEIKIEFFGNDRYFKYRYAQETSINVTTSTESWEMGNHASRYTILEEYLRRSCNAKLLYEQHKVDFFDIKKIYSEPNFFNNANIILLPTSESFFDRRQEYFSPSPVFETARTVIVSAAPKRVLSTSLSFLNMGTQVVILTVLTVVLLALLLDIHSIVMNKYKSLPKRKVVKKLAKETLENVWENASLLCAEPIHSILPHITCRLLASSWLIGVTFILFFLGCFLRTEFTSESYNCIDTLSDLIKSGIPPTMVEGSGTYDYVKYLAAKDPVVKEWLDAFDKENIISNPVEYMDSDGYIPIFSGEKALIAEDTLLVWILGQLLANDPESKELFMDEGGLYISQQDVYFDYMHVVLNTSWMKATSRLHEIIQLSVEPLFETQVLNHLDFRMHYLVDKVTWKKPLKSTADLDISSVFAPFYWLIILMSGTALVVIIEIVFNHFA